MSQDKFLPGGRPRPELGHPWPHHAFGVLRTGFLAKKARDPEGGEFEYCIWFDRGESVLSGFSFRIRQPFLPIKSGEKNRTVVFFPHTGVRDNHTVFVWCSDGVWEVNPAFVTSASPAR